MSTLYLSACAQTLVQSFLKDISFYDIQLNTSLKNIQKNKKIKNDLSLVFKKRGEAVYSLNNQNINLFGLATFNSAQVIFKNKLLKTVVLTSLDDNFEKVYFKLCDKYGKPKSSPIKNSLNKIYVWSDGKHDLMLKPSKMDYLLKFSFSK